MKILAFAASLRRGSLNKKLITAVAGMLRELGGEVDLADFAEFDMPLYDGDLDEIAGLPPGARLLADLLAQSHAVMIAAPAIE